MVYNNNGMFWSDRNATSSTISRTVLENNERMLARKLTRTSLSLDRGELMNFIATDQGPLTGALNHADLGAHLDHGKLHIRGNEAIR